MIHLSQKNESFLFSFVTSTKQNKANILYQPVHLRQNMQEKHIPQIKGHTALNYNKLD